MRFALFLAATITGQIAWASNQTIICYGIQQEGNLSFEFRDGREGEVYATINDEGQLYMGRLTKKIINRRAKTFTYANAKETIKVTIPQVWLNKPFERFSKHDRNGSQITEQTRFAFGKGQTLSITECESDVD